MPVPALPLPLSMLLTVLRFRVRFLTSSKSVRKYLISPLDHPMTKSNSSVRYEASIRAQHRGRSRALDRIHAPSIRNDYSSFDRTEFSMPDLDFDIEVERFYASIDGLAIHAVLRPEVLTMEKTKAVLHRHLQSLCRTYTGTNANIWIFPRRKVEKARSVQK